MCMHCKRMVQSFCQREGEGSGLLVVSWAGAGSTGDTSKSRASKSRGEIVTSGQPQVDKGKQLSSLGWPWNNLLWAGVGLETSRHPFQPEFFCDSVTFKTLLYPFFFSLLCYYLVFLTTSTCFPLIYTVLRAILKAGCQHLRLFCTNQGLGLLLKLNWVPCCSAECVPSLFLVHWLN